MPSKYHTIDSCRRMVLLFSVSVLLSLWKVGRQRPFSHLLLDHEPLSIKCNSSLFFFLPLSYSPVHPNTTSLLVFVTKLSRHCSKRASFLALVLVQASLPLRVSRSINRSRIRIGVQGGWCMVISSGVVWLLPFFRVCSFFFSWEDHCPCHVHSSVSFIFSPTKASFFPLFLFTITPSPLNLSHPSPHPFSFERYSSLIHKLNTVQGRAK